MFLSLSIYIMLYISMFHPLFLCLPMKLSKIRPEIVFYTFYVENLVFVCVSPRPHVSTYPRPISYPRVPAHASHVPNTRPASQSPSPRPTFSHSRERARGSEGLWENWKYLHFASLNSQSNVWESPFCNPFRSALHLD